MDDFPTPPVTLAGGIKTGVNKKMFTGYSTNKSKGPQVQYFNDVVVSEYNNFPVLILNATSWYNKFTFGRSRAIAIMAKLQEIRDFNSRPLMHQNDTLPITDNFSITHQQAQFILINEIHIRNFIEKGVI